MKIWMVVVVLLTAPFTRPSSAQTDCASSISTGCDSTSQTNSELIINCCAALHDAADFDRKCFCLVLDTALTQNPTTSGDSYTQLLSLCGILGTVDSLCSAVSTPTSGLTPIQTPETDTLTPVYTPYTLAPSPSSGSKTKLIIIVSVVAVAVVVSIVVGTICLCCKRKPKPYPASNPQTGPNVVNNPKVEEPNVANYASVEPNNVATYAENVYGGVTEHVVQSPSVDTPVQAPISPAPAATNKDGLIPTEASLQYELSTLQAATNNFSKENKIGRGGFGIVYKGMLADGREIAVKRLSNGSGQGDKEFKNEVVFLAKLQHRNLVKLLGFCLADDEALLVYEFVPNKSLDYILFDTQKREQLNWQRRFEIIKDIARGMLYLHEDSPVRTIHRDLKAVYVLLDTEMNAKIADFGMARICDVDQTHVNATQVVGTYGYMAPEYLFHGQFSVKSDIYSLGVIVLEIVSGRKISGPSLNQPGGSESLLSYAWRCWEDEKPMEIMDPILRDSYSNDEVIRCIQLGLLCVQEDTTKRPNMSTIVHMLNSYSGGALSMPQHPAFIYSGNSHQSTMSTSTKSNTTRSMPWPEGR